VAVPGQRLMAIAVVAMLCAVGVVVAPTSAAGEPSGPSLTVPPTELAQGLAVQR
jgi:hypothetical protein